MSGEPKELPAILFAGGQPLDIFTAGKILSPVFKEFQDPKVAYIGAANGDSTAFFFTVKNILSGAGASEVAFVKLASDNADARAARDALARADIIFLSGGEVEDGINWLKKHGLFEFLKELHRDGRQFVGISAGAIMAGAYWVRWGVPGDDDTASLFECLGLSPKTFDTHAEDEDWIELKTALRLLGDGSRGYGIPRGGVIAAYGDGGLVNLKKEYLTFTYELGEYTVK